MGYGNDCIAKSKDRAGTGRRGGAGLAHIGVLKVLEREKIPIHCISGTSMGGLLGALFAMGVPVAEIEKEIQRVVRVRELVKLLDIGISQGGALRGRRIYRYIAERLGAERHFC